MCMEEVETFLNLIFRVYEYSARRMGSHSARGGTALQVTLR